MFTIYGGNTEFNQWDLNQRVVEPRLVAGDKVIFLNSSGMTYPMKAYDHGGEVVVDVPNKLLTMAVPMVVYINGYYETRTSFNVVAREKPEDYIFVDNDDWPSDSDSSGVGLPKVIDLDTYGGGTYDTSVGSEVVNLLFQGGGEQTGVEMGNLFSDLTTDRPIKIQFSMPFNGTNMARITVYGVTTVRIDGQVQELYLTAQYAGLGVVASVLAYITAGGTVKVNLIVPNA